MKENRTAIIVGATGLIGHQLVLLLSRDTHFSKVTALSRRAIESLPPYIENKRIDFENPIELEKGLVGTDLFFCFGTTLKQAGTPERFRQIEWGISKAILETAKGNGIKNLYLVSAMGANSKSSILYSRIKGELEELASRLNFESVCILRPSLLLGDRTEHRLGEAFAQKFSSPLVHLMKGPLLRYRPVEGRLVAKRLVELSLEPKSGCRVIDNRTLHNGKIS